MQPIHQNLSLMLLARREISFTAWLVFSILLLVPYSAFAQTCTPAPSGAIAWWPFDETSGTIAQDIVGTKPGAHFGTPTPTPGKVGGALRFNGVDEFVGVGDSDLWAFGANNFTIELWANFSSPGGGSLGHPSHIFIGSDDGPGLRNKWFFALGGGYLNFHTNGPAIGAKFLPLVPFSPNLNQWYHLAVTRNGSTLTIYINGTPSGSATNADVIPNASASLTIGQAESLGFMNGLLDDIAIYNRALTQAELQAIVNAGSAGKCKSQSAFASAISPSSGGDTGSVTVRINGSGFLDGASVKLVRAGYPDIVGNPVSVDQDSRTTTTTFDLTGKVRGLWDLVVMNPSSTPITFPQKFSIEEGRDARLWVDIVGHSGLRLGRESTYYFLIGNSGNVDSTFSFLAVKLPSELSHKLDAPPGFPVEADTRLEDFSSFAVSIPAIAPSAITQIPLKLSTSQPGSFDLAAGIVSLTRPTLASQAADLDSYPARWRPKFPGDQPPPGYVILWPEFGRGGAGSAAWVLDNGEVAHMFPNSNPNLDGLRVHRWDLISDVEPEVWRPPDWTLEKALERVQEFRRKWQSGTNIYDGKPTSYDNKFPVFGFPSTNCWGGVKFFWPEVKKLRDPTPLELEHVIDAITDAFRAYWKNAETPRSSPPQSKPKWTVALSQAFYEGLQIIARLLGLFSFDPNEKVGAYGVGSDRQRFLNGSEPLRYAVLFENLATAPAPAQEVVITDQLDAANLDFTNFSLGPITFGNKQIIPPPGLISYQTEVDLRPGKNLLVRVEGNLNTINGLLIWRFTSIDPATGLPPDDPFAGFLPPNKVPPEGDGSVLFTVMPKKSLPTGTEIRNKARIIFDTNAPIDTPQWLNTLDNTKPTSKVLSVNARQCASSFQVKWSGSDVGAGVRDYTIFVSENNGPYVAWLSNTTATEGIFSGQAGKQYAFYSIARDLTNNPESAKSVAEATTQVVSPVALAAATLPNGAVGQAYPATNISFSGGAPPYTVNVTGLPTGMMFLVTGTTVTIKGTPTQAGNFNVNVTVQDDNACPVSRSYPLTVINTCGIVIYPTSLTQPYIGISYAQRLVATPTAAYTFSLAGGALPPGVQLVKEFSFYFLKGMPTTPGTYNFTIKARRNNSACENLRSYTVTIAPTVVPILECVQRNSNGNYTAEFGYDNTMGATVTIPVGASNYFTPGHQNRGQVTVFQPGRVRNAFSVTFTVANNNNLAIWLLKGPDGLLRPVNITTAKLGCP